MFDLQACDETIFETAPIVHSVTLDLPVPAARVWEGLAGERPLEWCRLLRNGRYTSPRPLGIGTTREITVGVGMHLREEFFRWEEGRRHSFFVTQASVPLFRRFAEDYILEPLGDDQCRLTWTIAFEPSKLIARPASVAAGGNKLILAWLERDTRRHFGG
ncbi:SRPBCC family protein [Lolliginicoccus suaedae]|uniref:SRPBCC family protein n=1 Tax=Lolliginicoccus suaedae TaxID=2605429 RepID=UPI0011EE57BD|nr:SRPBCC family protein [Lolliginicoccus suaedae]